MFPAQGPYWLGVCCHEDQTQDCLFGYLLSVSPWDLASTLPATGSSFYPLLWLRTLHDQAELPGDLHLPAIQLSLTDFLAH